MLYNKMNKSQNASVILFVILGSYLFLHIWENVLIKFGKISTKIHEIGKKRPFWIGNNSHRRRQKWQKKNHCAYTVT